MGEPDAAILNPPGGGVRLRRWALATRPAFFSASLLPVLAGTAWGWAAGGQLDGLAFALALGATIFAHGGINVLNDVFDDAGGTDRLNDERIFPFTGGSRFIQNKVLDAWQMRSLGWALLALATALGIALAALKGWPVLALGAGAVGLGVLYSAPPVWLAARGWGELAVGIGFGPIPVVGAAWLQSGTWDVGALLLSGVIGIWVTLILLINEVPDARADGESGKRTLAVRLGAHGTAILYFALHTLAVALVLVMVYFAILPPLAVTLPLLFLIVARPAALAIAASATQTPHDRRAPMTAAIKTTLAIQALGTVWLAGWAWAVI